MTLFVMASRFDENGKLERMGGWLTSKHQVKKAMTRVEELAKGLIPFEVVDMDGTTVALCT
jgi:hypothetical protein